MPSIQVREVPDVIYKKLAEGAKRDGRSIAQQALVLIAKMLEVDPQPKVRRQALLERLRREPVIGQGSAAFSAPSELIRQDRDR